MPPDPFGEQFVPQRCPLNLRPKRVHFVSYCFLSFRVAECNGSAEFMNLPDGRPAACILLPPPSLCPIAVLLHLPSCRSAPRAPPPSRYRAPVPSRTTCSAAHLFAKTHKCYRVLCLTTSARHGIKPGVSIGGLGGGLVARITGLGGVGIRGGRALPINGHFRLGFEFLFVSKRP